MCSVITESNTELVKVSLKKATAPSSINRRQSHPDGYFPISLLWFTEENKKHAYAADSAAEETPLSASSQFSITFSFFFFVAIFIQMPP